MELITAYIAIYDVIVIVMPLNIFTVKVEGHPADTDNLDFHNQVIFVCPLLTVRSEQVFVNFLSDEFPACKLSDVAS